MKLEKLLEQLERLESAATSGEWFVQGGVYLTSQGSIAEVRRSNVNIGKCDHFEGSGKPNARLIVAARNALPTLIAAFREAIDVIRDDATFEDYGAGAKEWLAKYNPED